MNRIAGYRQEGLKLQQVLALPFTNTLIPFVLVLLCFLVLRHFLVTDSREPVHARL